MAKLKIFVTLLLCSVALQSVVAKNVTLKSDKVSVEIDRKGNLVELRNLVTGHNYASGGYLWRMYYDTHDEQEIEIIGGEQSPKVQCDGESISLV